MIHREELYFCHHNEETQMKVAFDTSKNMNNSGGTVLSEKVPQVVSMCFPCPTPTTLGWEFPSHSERTEIILKGSLK